MPFVVEHPTFSMLALGALCMCAILLAVVVYWYREKADRLAKKSGFCGGWAPSASAEARALNSIGALSGANGGGVAGQRLFAAANDSPMPMGPRTQEVLIA